MHMRTTLTTALLIASTLLCTGANAAPTVDELAAVLWRYNDAAQTDLPIPNVAQLEALAQGKTVHLRERLAVSADNPDTDKSQRLRVVGYQLVHRPRLLVWLATLHAGTTHEPRLLEHRVRVNEDRSSTWYQHLNAPWPVRNRHWVIRSGKNVAVAEDTQDLAWEHRWTLEPRGRDIALNLMIENTFDALNERDFEHTIYLSENAGAWTMFEVEEDVTLVATHTTADMGGWIPDRWVAGFVARQLSSVLRELEDKADTIHEHYDQDDPVQNGHGQPISREQLSDARRRFAQSRERAASAPGSPAPHR